MQVKVNPYSTATGYGTPTHCDTDTEYASVVYSSSPTMARRTLMNPTRFNSSSQYTSLSPRPGQHTYLSPQLARLNSTLRPSAHTMITSGALTSANGSPVHRQSAMSSTTTLSTCLSPRTGRYPLSEAEMGGLQSGLTYFEQPNIQNHVYCEIPVSTPNSQHQSQNKQQSTGLRVMQQQQLRTKLRQQQDLEAAEFYENDTTQCDLHNISDLSDDEQWSFSTTKVQQNSSAANSPKHFPNSTKTQIPLHSTQRQQFNNGSPSHNNKKPKRFVNQRLSPPPLKQSTKDKMSQLPATDV